MSIKKIPTRQLGANGPVVSTIGLGTMGIGALYGTTDFEAVNDALNYAADRGMTFWDCADMYGKSEAVLGDWFTKTGRRSEIFLATKFGSRDPDGDFHDPKNGPNSKPSYIHKAIKRSLTNLKTDHIDLFYQHRVDPNVPIEVVMETLRPYVEKGTIRYIGLSECSASTLQRAKAVKGVGEKLIVVQMEFSPFSLHIEQNGFVDAARELGVGIVAYSPLGRGMASGQYRSRADFDKDDFRLMLPRFSEENFPKNLQLADKIKEIADAVGATGSQVTLAWILAEHKDFIPIPGCRSQARVEENAAGAEVTLSRDQLASIRKLCEAAETQGQRYPDAFMKALHGESLPLDQWKGE